MKSLKKVLHFGNPARLSLKFEQLVIELEGKGPITRPLEDVGSIVIDHQQVRCSTPLIAKAAEKGVVIVWCDAKHLPVSYSLPYVGNNLQNLRHRQQWEAGKPVIKQAWAQLIQAKLKNQALVLDMRGGDGSRLHHLSQQVRSGDPDNLEAVGARHYWSRVFGRERGFSRDPGGGFPNNFLNYGYAIVRAGMARALAGAGLCLSIGVFHHNQYNPFVLADDCMEPYRPWVDLLVAGMAEGRDEGELDKDSKAELLTLLHQDVFVGGKQRPMMLSMDGLAQSLAFMFAGEEKELKLPFLDV